MRNLKVIAATTGLIMSVVFAAGAAIPAAKHAKKTPAAHGASGALVAQGKALSMRCAGCHNTGLVGRPGMTPSLHQSGVLKEYNQKSFAKLLDTGITNDGKPLKRMPVLHMKAADSNAIYAYLKTLK